MGEEDVPGIPLELGLRVKKRRRHAPLPLRSQLTILTKCILQTTSNSFCSMYSAMIAKNRWACQNDSPKKRKTPKKTGMTRQMPVLISTVALARCRGGELNSK